MSTLKYWVAKVSKLTQCILGGITAWIISLLSNRTLRYWLKVSRLTQCVIGGITAWIISLLSNGNMWLTQANLFAGIATFFSIWGASVWHYGARAEIYADKHWDPVFVKDRALLMRVGASGFFISILLSWIFLSTWCIAVTVINAITIMFLYTKHLDLRWPWKNISIALICITPIIMGWFSGHRLNPVVPSLIFATFFIYLAREIFKDMVDEAANKGKRITMIMDLGPTATARIGGSSLTAAIILILNSLEFAPASLVVWMFFILGTVWLAWFAIESLKGINVSQKFRWMDGGVAMILMALISTKFYMH